MKAVQAIVVASVLGSALSFPGFRDSIPNAFNVLDCDGNAVTAIGHDNPAGGGSRNAFGRDYDAVGRTWAELCDLDSDDDGMTNGEELGDPGCEWTSTNGFELGEVLGHPSIDCSPNATASPTVTPTLSPAVWAHGMLMLISWVLFAPVGLLIPMFNKTRISPKVKAWFVIHRALMATIVALTLISYLIILNARGFILYDAHTRTGLAVIVLTVVQPFNGVMRVHNHPGEPKSKARIAWEYFHQWTGRLLMILAIAASILGLDLAGTTLNAQNVTDGIRYFIAVIFALGSVACFVYVFLMRPDERKLERAKTGKPDFEKQPLKESGDVEKGPGSAGGATTTVPAQVDTTTASAPAAATTTAPTTTAPTSDTTAAPAATATTTAQAATQATAPTQSADGTKPATNVNEVQAGGIQKA